MLTFAERTARDNGKRYLRLDCACENEELRAYYMAAGFRWRGDTRSATGSGHWCGALFERSLYLVTRTS